MGFLLFGIYEQQLEWSGEKHIRFANVCFSNETAFPQLTIKRPFKIAVKPTAERLDRAARNFSITCFG
jgi:hypothetical protein